MPHNELLDLLISQFSQAPYWSLKSLNEHVKQPQTYLKQTLGEIANLVRNGPYAGMYALKPEFKQGVNDQVGQQQLIGGSGVKDEEGIDGDDGGRQAEFRVKKEEGVDLEGDEEAYDEDDGEDGMEVVS